MASILFSLPTNPLPERLHEYRLKGKLTDFTIKVGNEKFAAHKIVLEDSSPVLKALLSENWIKDDVCEFKEQFVDPNIVEDLLGFFYTSKLLLTLDNAFSICVASHFLNIPILVSASEEFLSDHMSLDNITELFQLSEKLNLETLKKKCIEYASAHHEVVLKDKKIDYFDLEKLKKLIHQLNDKYSDPKMKESLYWMIISWTEYNLEKRLSFLPALLRSIPLFDLSIKFLSEIVSVQSLIYETKTCLALLIDAFNQSLKDSQEFSTMNGMFCFGELDKNEAISSIYISIASQWNILNGKSEALFSVIESRYKFASVANGKKIYLLGRPFSEIGTLEVYDCLAKRFTQLESMPGARRSYVALAFKENIYVSGGADDTGKTTASVIRYNIETNEWSEVNSMIEKRVHHQFVELDGLLYAIGGEESNTAEKYDPVNDQWTVIASTHFKHSYSGATVHRSKLYVCSRAGFEVYSPCWNSWKVLPSFRNREGKTSTTDSSMATTTFSSESEARQKMLQSANSIAAKRQIIDARDFLYRERTAMNVDSNDKTVLGTCPDMCPERERLFRIENNLLSDFEKNEFGEPDERRMVKEFRRSGPNQNKQLPHDLRDGEVMQRTMDYLCLEIVPKILQDDTNLRSWYQFIWDRTRCFRKDITLQMICNTDSVSLIEKCARFHIFSSFYLCEQDSNVFDIKMNTKNLSDCLQSLKEQYKDLELKTGQYSPNEAEFRAYDILVNMHNFEVVHDLKNFREEIRNDKKVQLAFKLHCAFHCNNIPLFFKLVKKCDFFTLCLLNSIIHELRFTGLNVIRRSFKNGSKKAADTVSLPKSFINDLFCFGSLQEVDEFCDRYKLEYDEHSLSLPRFRNFGDQQSELSRANNIVMSECPDCFGRAILGPGTSAQKLRGFRTFPDGRFPTFFLKSSFRGDKLVDTLNVDEVTKFSFLETSTPNGKLWTLGGGKIQKEMKSVFSYDTFTEKWQKVRSIKIGRSDHSLFVIRE